MSLTAGMGLMGIRSLATSGGPQVRHSSLKVSAAYVAVREQQNTTFQGFQYDHVQRHV